MRDEFDSWFDSEFRYDGPQYKWLREQNWGVWQAARASQWRPISEHDGTPYEVDLWVVDRYGKGKRYADCRLGGRGFWVQYDTEHGEWMAAFAHSAKATHYCELPQPPEVQG